MSSTEQPTPSFALGEDGELYQMWLIVNDNKYERLWRRVPRLPTSRQDKGEMLDSKSRDSSSDSAGGVS